MIYYLVIINVISFFAYLLDKIFAIKKRNRISEYHLLCLTIFGGCFFSLISMYLFHHKTKKKKFLLINIVSIVVWLIFLTI